ncbi:proline dehydrogenase family protein [Solicola gregarius]|uniref:proline dehydrogenase n=1 Tax=Solicola gregarius TaxID=2908642 RepID=A0AA46YK79_9ACTN|nr:proline dehydrogenase family protein [Solicola gregarius]UYM05445.1 proline dehydrogenase family protein [Solicola gregarius]
MSVLRSTFVAASRSPRLRSTAERSSILTPVVERFVAGTDVDAAIEVARDLAADRYVSLDHLGEATTDPHAAEATVEAYATLLHRLDAEGLTGRAEVSVKLSALGQALGDDGQKIARDNLLHICSTAADVGATVTVDMEDHTTTDSTLEIVRDVRADFPSTGTVLQASLRRTEADCHDLAGRGSRIRLCKGAYDEPVSVAYRTKAEVDASYVRCMRILMTGQGYPMVATHDPALVTVGEQLAIAAGRGRDAYEFQMLYGIRPTHQSELAAAGHKLRIYVPYGTEWYPYFMRRLGERPANIGFFLRSFTGRS